MESSKTGHNPTAPPEESQQSFRHTESDVFNAVIKSLQQITINSVQFVNYMKTKCNHPQYTELQPCTPVCAQLRMYIHTANGLHRLKHGNHSTHMVCTNTLNMSRTIMHTPLTVTAERI